jgi:tetratricopeptide (TPR) repeat protein
VLAPTRAITLRLTPTSAAELGLAGCAMLEDLGDTDFLSTAAGGVSQAMYALGRIAEARAWADRARELSAPDDVFTEILWRQSQAKVLASEGAHGEAQRLAREAVEISSESTFLNGQAMAHADLAEVFAPAGKREEAATALGQAVGLYDRKGKVTAAADARVRLSQLMAVGL